jgi:ATP-dependent Lon protease
MSQPLRGGASAPKNPFPLLPLRNGVVFPGTRVTLPVGRDKSVALLSTVHPGDIVGVVTQRDASLVDPGEDDVHRVGIYARIHHVGRVSDSELRLIIEGIGRFELDRLVERDPYWRADGHVLEDIVTDADEAHDKAEHLRAMVRELASRGLFANVSLADSDEPGVVADQIASSLGLPTEQEVEVLETLDILKRLDLVTELLGQAKGAAEVRKKIESEVRKEIGKNQRDALLREQMKAIKKELGDDEADVAAQLRAKLEAVGLTKEAKTVADRELKRLETMSPQSAEYNVVRNYLEWIADLPWSARAEVKDDLDAIGAKLDADHYGLEDVKRRILEHMAVLKLSGNPRGGILCLVGPPGVGKTSLGQSIADATGRPFVRIALGGIRDEAEIRGHRRTYVGALPGRILNAMRKAKAKNPILLLDEVDKLTVGWSGSPESALLEVLDPEQNRTFTDHYLEIPFDLSEVIFLCTANTLETLSAPLRDRLEVIDVSGYTLDEKMHIARKHLIPKQLKEHGMAEQGALTITDSALRETISAYTREAGVRQLNRQITKMCRALALEVARKGSPKEAKQSKDAKDTSDAIVVDEENLSHFLGKPRFFADVAERTEVPGVATGLAWTPVGGDILFIETSRMPGKGRLEITGQLGDVMKESARAALTYVRSNAQKLGVEPHFLESQDVHVHVPAGGVPKDGPSAGVTIFTALTSLLTGRRVRSDTAMTGEVTLRGRVLPVGGIKAKVLAAHRAGITRVILPKKNLRDFDEVPEDVRRSLEVFFAEDMSQVLDAALEKERVPDIVPLGPSAAPGTEAQA